MRRLNGFVVLVALSTGVLPGQDSEPPRIVVYPGAEWGRANPAEMGWSLSKLEEAHAAFAAMPPASMAIVDDGRLIAAWGDLSQRVKISSMRKSLLSALFGIAVARRSVNLDATLSQLDMEDQPPLSAEEKRATVRMLLEARSGVYHSYVAGTPAMRAAMPQAGSHAPGSHWAYNNWDFNALGAIFEKETRLKIGEAFRAEIAIPLQMQDYRPEDMYYLRAGADAKQYERSTYPAYHFRMSARDLARFGYLFLRRGSWIGKEILPAAWIEESTRSYSDAGDGRGYGYLWWRDYLKLPAENIDAVGALAKYMFIFPDRHLVVVYLNHAEFPDNAADMTEVQLNALPAASPAQMTTLLTLVIKAQAGANVEPGTASVR